MSPLSERFELRLDEDTIAAVDEWRGRQSDVPSRSEAFRRLIQRSLADTGESLHFTGPEKLVVALLCDVMKAVKAQSEIDPKILLEAMYGGHYWGLEWEYSGLFHHHADRREVVREVTDILDMWSFIESAYEDFDAKAKARIRTEVGPIGKDVKFHGFDGNNEGEHFSVALFMTRALGRFERFTKRDLNSHCPSLEAHGRMLEVFRPMRSKLMGKGLSADQVIELLTARTHPEMRGKK